MQALGGADQLGYQTRTVRRRSLARAGELGPQETGADPGAGQTSRRGRNRVLRRVLLLRSRTARPVLYLRQNLDGHYVKGPGTRKKLRQGRVGRGQDLNLRAPV